MESLRSKGLTVPELRSLLKKNNIDYIQVVDLVNFPDLTSHMNINAPKICLVTDQHNDYHYVSFRSHDFFDPIGLDKNIYGLRNVPAFQPWKNCQYEGVSDHSCAFWCIYHLLFKKDFLELPCRYVQGPLSVLDAALPKLNDEDVIDVYDALKTKNFTL